MENTINNTLPGQQINSGSLPAPKLSIILPVYNGGKYLRETIQSVINQTFADFELLIIDDGSSDTSTQIAEIFTNDKRVKLIKNPKNLGLIATLNKGFELATGIYIARIDADDLWSDVEKIKKQVDYLDERKDVVLIGTGAHIINESGNILHDLSYPTTDTEIRSSILIRNCFIHPSIILRKEAAISAGLFLNDEKYVEDYGLWLRIGKYGKFANIQEPLMSYRINSGGETQKNNLAQTRNSLKIISKHKKDYPNFFLGWLKWNTKIILLHLLGLKNLNSIKEKINS